MAYQSVTNLPKNLNFGDSIQNDNNNIDLDNGFSKEFENEINNFKAQTNPQENQSSSYSKDSGSNLASGILQGIGGGDASAGGIGLAIDYATSRVGELINDFKSNNEIDRARDEVKRNYQLARGDVANKLGQSVNQNYQQGNTTGFSINSPVVSEANNLSQANAGASLRGLSDYERGALKKLKHQNLFDSAFSILSPLGAGLVGLITGNKELGSDALSQASFGFLGNGSKEFKNNAINANKEFFENL